MIGSYNKELYMDLARQIIDPLAENVKQIIVYGSRARGTLMRNSSPAFALTKVSKVA